MLATSEYWRLPLPEFQITPPVTPRLPDAGPHKPLLQPAVHEANLEHSGFDFWKLPLPFPCDFSADEDEAALEASTPPIQQSASSSKYEAESIAQLEVELAEVEVARVKHVDFTAASSISQENEDEQARWETIPVSELSPMSANCDILACGDTWFQFSLPYELVGRAFYYLDCRSLLRCGRTCSEWGRLSRSKGRWRNLFKADWGMRGPGSRREYRQWLDRWSSMKSALGSLKGRGHPGNNFGSAPRRQLYKVLESIVDLCAAENRTATYPSCLSNILRENGALDLMLALLDDESSRLVNLALKCLGDIAIDPLSKSALREALHNRNTLIREFLEGADVDLAEAATRVLLNLIDDSFGTPLCLRRRGPFEFMPEGSVLTPLGLASSWVGVWSGEMRYARSGACDSVLHLVLGFAHDPVVAQVASHIQASCLRDSSDPSSRCPEKYLLEDAGELQKWCNEFEHDTRKSDSVLNLAGWPPACDPVITGAGVDEKAGAFTAELQLPSAVGVTNFAATGMPWTQAPAAPAKLLFQYNQRVVKIELVGFLSEGTGVSGEKLCAMYGIWGTVPPRQRHLFVLRRLATLPVPQCH